MRFSHWIPGLLMISALAFAGCGKSDAPAPTVSTAHEIDASNFRPAFSSAKPEIKAIVDNVMMSLQGSSDKDALAGLNKLASLPDLSEAQKKVVADLSDQIKRKQAALSP